MHLIYYFFFFLGDILMNPIIRNAGKDISHWFDKKTKNVCIKYS